MMIFGSTTSAVIGIGVQAVVGFFAGADYAAGVKLLASWFQPKELGKVMGLFTSATSLGTVIANTAVPWMINHYSWHASYHLFGAISIVTAVICYVIIRPGPVTNTIATAGDGKRPSAWKTLTTNRDLMLLSLAGFGGFWAHTDSSPGPTPCSSRDTAFPAPPPGSSWRSSRAWRSSVNPSPEYSATG